MSLWCWLVRWYRPKPTTFEQMRLVIQQYDDEKNDPRHRRPVLRSTIEPTRSDRYVVRS